VSTAAIRVLLFATLRQQAGRSTVELILDEPASVAGCWERLCEQIPALASMKDTVRPALNRDYVPWEALAQPGDELAFIPPVSGGRR
jgi:molybdopterin converting factor subunit 1